MTIAESLKKHSNIEIEILLGYVLNKPKEFLYLNRELKLSATQVTKLEQLAKQRALGMPIAYLIGEKYFYGLNFKVNENVLIPRPESEWLIDEALRIIKKRQQRLNRKMLRVLDIGTGSGAIAVSLAFNSDPTKVDVYASDISDKALKLAKQNANRAKVKINFIKSDLLTKVSGKFDIVIANLPYVPQTDYKKYYDNLKYEPKLALTDGTDDFILIKKLITQLPKVLNKDGVVILEIDPKAAQLKIPIRYKKQIIKDIHKLDRYIKLTSI